MEDSGGTKDIEFIHKGMLELFVNLLLIFVFTIIYLDLVANSSDMGLGLRTNPTIYPYPPAHVFIGGCCTFNSYSRFFSSLTTVAYQIAEISSKHGLILDCSLQIMNMCIMGTTFALLTQWVCSFLQGKHYGFLHEAGQEVDSGASHLRCEQILDVKAWLEDAVKCNLDSS